jgi:hypothetical protein
VTVPNRLVPPAQQYEGLTKVFQRQDTILLEGLEDICVNALGSDFDLNEGIRQAFSLVGWRAKTGNLPALPE